MFDLDHFKAVNDSFGHMAGDQLLALFGQVLRDQLRVTDIPCRYGGEEFMIIAPETTADRAQVLAERVRRVFSKSSAELTTGPQTVSVGIAGTEVLEGRADRASLVLAADTALYLAKGRGRDRVEVGGAPPKRV
jgi:diguanylate cyclase (GGDEF)-like protein